MDNGKFETKLWDSLKRYRSHRDEARLAGEIFIAATSYAISYAQRCDSRVATAARYFADTWAELLGGMLQDEYGCQMNCAEANAAADLYRALGDDKTAEAIIAAHARYDTGEDEHAASGEGASQ